MSTIVYLANQQIQVITGTQGVKKIAVSGCYSAQAPDGSIINGMIMDPELFVGFMQEFWTENKLPFKDVVLVINSTKFIGKTIEMPVLNEKKTLEYIDREYSDIRHDEEYICGYIPISQTGKQKKIYAEIISPDFVKEYMDIFQEIGVKVKAVYSGESSLIRLAAMTVGKVYRTFVLQIADRMTITTILWVDGSFYYFNSTRCFHEQGTEDYAQDIARSVSQIRQFMQANQIDHPIETVVLAGLAPNDLPLYQNAISQLEIYARVEMFSAGNIQTNNMNIHSFFHAASGLVLAGSGSRQNFLDGYNAGRKKDKQRAGIGKGLIAIFISLAVMLIGFAVSVTIRTAKNRELSALKEYNESPLTMMEVAKYDVLLSRNAFLGAQYSAIDGVNQNLYTYPLCNREVMDRVYDCAGNYATITFESFDADMGVMTVKAQSDTVDNINKFIKQLSALDIVSNVNYTGYSYIDDVGLWDIHVTFYLAESAGRKPETKEE